MENKTKILIVDDDKFLLDMYSLKFSEQGYDVPSVSSSEDALAKLESGYEPDVCLVDIIMPGMDGFQLISEIKKRNLCKKSTIIILSNLGQKEDVEQGLAIGADGYIIKASATPSEVVSKVVEISNSKK